MVLRNGDRTLATYAMLDTAATRCAISPSLVAQLGLETRTSRTTLASFGYKTTCEREHVDLTVEPLDGTFSLDLKDALVGEILTTEQDKLPSYADIEGLDFMEGTVTFPELDVAVSQVCVHLGPRRSLVWTP